MCCCFLSGTAQQSISDDLNSTTQTPWLGLASLEGFVVRETCPDVSCTSTEKSACAASPRGLRRLPHGCALSEAPDGSQAPDLRASTAKSVLSLVEAVQGAT